MNVKTSFLAGLSLLSLALFSVQAKAENALVESALEADTFFSMSAFVDDAAKSNIRDFYIPDVKKAYAYSIHQNKKTGPQITTEMKKAKLKQLLANGRSYLEAQQGQAGYSIIAALVNSKFAQFDKAIEDQDFNRTAELAQSAYNLLKHFQ